MFYNDLSSKLSEDDKKSIVRALREFGRKYPLDQVDKSLRQLHAQANHVSVVKLGRWQKGRISDSEFTDYLEQFKEHLQDCERCQDNYRDAYQQRTQLNPEF